MNPTKKTIPIALDKPRALMFDMNALVAIEEKTGKNMLDPESWQGRPTAGFMRIMLWAGLLHEDPGLTLDQVGSMLHPGATPMIQESLAAAMAEAMPDDEDGGQDGDGDGEAAANGAADPPGGPGDGSSSGPLPARTSG